MCFIRKLMSHKLQRLCLFSSRARRPSLFFRAHQLRGILPKRPRLPGQKADAENCAPNRNKTHHERQCCAPATVSVIESGMACLENQLPMLSFIKENRKRKAKSLTNLHRFDCQKILTFFTETSSLFFAAHIERSPIRKAGLIIGNEQ